MGEEGKGNGKYISSDWWKGKEGNGQLVYGTLHRWEREGADLNFHHTCISNNTSLRAVHGYFDNLLETMYTSIDLTSVLNLLQVVDSILFSSIQRNWGPLNSSTF